MDLSKCKLICRSRAKLTDKGADYKYWESSVSSSKSPIRQENFIIRGQQGLYASKSTVRFQPRNREKCNDSLNDIKGIGNLAKRQVPRLSPIQMPEEKKYSSVYVSVPIFQKGESLKNYMKPNGLVPIHKPREEKEVTIIEWNTNVSRNGPVGSKFTRVKSKSPMLRQRLEKIEDREQEEDDNSDSDRMFSNYREPYLQALLEKKAKDFNNLFNNPVEIV